MRASKRARREAKELFRGCAVNGVLDENRVRQTVQHVVAAGRHDSPAVLSFFRRLLKLDLARRTATIESATPLPADLRAAVETGLTRLYGPGLTTAFAYRPALIGGVRIQVGCDVYDDSVRARLDTLQMSF
jgi:F-type H+-transporting ATPase subunit delta